VSGVVLHGDQFFPPEKRAGAQYAQVFQSSSEGGSAIRMQAASRDPVLRDEIATTRSSSCTATPAFGRFLVSCGRELASRRPRSVGNSRTSAIDRRRIQPYDFGTGRPAGKGES